MQTNVFLVGPRYRHHSGHSGYERFQRFVGTPVWSPISQRFLSNRLGRYPLVGDLGWRLDQAAATLTARRLYSVNIFILEAMTAMHMAVRRGAVYHVLYGDSDIWLLGHAGRWTGNVVCATFHDPVHILEWLGVQRVASQLDGVICLCDDQRRFFEQFMPSERVFLIPHSIDTHFFAPGSGVRDYPVLVTAGSKLRDFALLSTVMQLVWQQAPDVRLVAIGTRRRGDSNPHLDLTDHRVTFFDGIADDRLRALYQESSVAVLPLTHATANNTLLEAMACGVPIVATDVGGVREYAGEGPALLCPAESPAQMASAILKVLRDDQLRRAMSEAARRRACLFAHEKIVEQLGRAYSALYGNRTRLEAATDVVSDGDEQR